MVFLAPGLKNGIFEEALIQLYSLFQFLTILHWLSILICEATNHTFPWTNMFLKTWFFATWTSNHNPDTIASNHHPLFSPLHLYWRYCILVWQNELEKILAHPAGDYAGWCRSPTGYSNLPTRPLQHRVPCTAFGICDSTLLPGCNFHQAQDLSVGDDWPGLSHDHRFYWLPLDAFKVRNLFCCGNISGVMIQKCHFWQAFFRSIYSEF